MIFRICPKHGPQPVPMYPLLRLRNVNKAQMAVFNQAKCFTCQGPLGFVEKFGKEADLIKEYLCQVSVDYKRQQAMADSWVNKTSEQIAQDYVSEGNMVFGQIEQSSKIMQSLRKNSQG